MKIYNYTEGCPVDQVTFKTTDNGSIRAYLHAREGTQCGTLEPLKKTLKAREWDYIPCAVDGKSALEVRGFKRESDLITQLAEKKLINGQPDIQLPPKEELSWRKTIEKRSMQLSGMFMSAADACFLGYGVKGKSLLNALGGISYLSGSLTLGWYGKNDQSNFQIREMAKLILDHAKEQGLTLPEDSTAAVLNRKRPQGVLRQLDNLFREYPSEMGNMLYVAAGTFVAAGAWKQLKAVPHADKTLKQIYESRLANKMDIGLGSCTMLAGLLATFVKEKAHDPDAPKAKGFQAFKEWIQASPLRIASYLYLGSTACHTFSTIKDYKTNKAITKDPASTSSLIHSAEHELKAIKWRSLFITGTIIGEVLLSISSKGHGEGVVSDESINNSVIAIAAELIAKQSPSTHEEIIKNMAAYLGQPEILAQKDSVIAEKLRAQVDALRNNPWAQGEAEQSAEPPATIPMKKENALPAWQAKAAMAAAARQQNTQARASA